MNIFRHIKSLWKNVFPICIGISYPRYRCFIMFESQAKLEIDSLSSQFDKIRRNSQRYLDIHNVYRLPTDIWQQSLSNEKRISESQIKEIWKKIYQLEKYHSTLSHLLDSYSYIITKKRARLIRNIEFQILSSIDDIQHKITEMTEPPIIKGQKISPIDPYGEENWDE